MFKLTTENKLTLRLDPDAAMHMLSFGSTMVVVGLVLAIPFPFQYSWDAVGQAVERLPESWWRYGLMVLAALLLGWTAIKLMRRLPAASEWTGTIAVLCILSPIGLPIVGFPAKATGWHEGIVVIGWMVSLAALSALISNAVLNRLDRRRISK